MSEAFVGEIRMFCGNFVPIDWAFCDGQLVPISQYNALFSLIGTTYGGDGMSTFGLPDLRGRLPMHMGQGPGLSRRTRGEKSGVEQVTLTTNQIPVHTHTPQAVSGNGNQSTPQNGVWAGVAGASRYSSSAPNLAMNNTLVGSIGGGQPHNNQMPFLAVNFIIALNGTWPTQS